MSRRGTRGRRVSRGRRLGRWVLVAVAVFVVVVLAIIALWYLLAGRVPPPIPTPPPPDRPQSQPASCPDVQVVAIPGTWESSAVDDPYNPTANPLSLMLNITRPLQERFDSSRADVYTVPYVAQFSNPVALPPDGQQSYNNSRGEGTARATEFIAARHAECPLTTFALTGFSQGAVIAGDLAARIGSGDGPIPADQVLGVGLIADGRRDPAHGLQVGPPVAGVGAELSLAGLEVPGITMTGPRPGGFGELDDRTATICAPSDGICDAPPQAFRPGNWISSAARLLEYNNNPVHALYNTFVVDDSGATSTQWTASWLGDKIDAAPHPPHS
ncbi:cutinase family protein [Rhodococcus triatomae]|uniref:Cutinase n=1 Tax=Rhodococcus triatomae TaxID=300028 RepID=A0A1G8HZD6_9NOCA|nr:cutinase family protein [Rhodococcus triatomae]QNG20916.1 cutinase family protein [Rhodococcus triatomae]QNG23169.1 cutinase family protein [Rhodococcus triatomae]SDI11977.1 Cutinase [Rhodococcus triatomae]